MPVTETMKKTDTQNGDLITGTPLKSSMATAAGTHDVAGMEEEDGDARSEATFQFVVPHFSKLKDSVLSSPCYIRNIPWKIMVRLSTDKASNRQNQVPRVQDLGFFLQCNNGESESSWSCYAVAELRLLAVDPEIEAISRKIQHLFSSKESDWGYSRFKTWDDVLDPEKGYIEDDTITLEVHVVADPPRGISQDSKEVDQYKKQLEKVNAHVKTLKKQVDEAEEEVLKEKAQRQKYQREYEDMFESHETCVKLVELETAQRAKTRLTISTLESKVANLEEERLAQQKSIRKQDKKLKEMVMQLEDERKHGDQYKKQLEKVNARVKILKIELDEAGEEISTEKAEKRKYQRKYEDVFESHEALTREVSNLKRKLSELNIQKEN